MSKLNLLAKLIAFSFIVFFVFSHTCNKHPQLRPEEQRQALWGIVKRIYHLRGDKVSIIQLNGKEFEISEASDCLYNNARIGDTIVKYENSNRCVIIRGYTIECECYYSGN